MLLLLSGLLLFSGCKKEEDEPDTRIRVWVTEVGNIKWWLKIDDVVVYDFLDADGQKTIVEHGNKLGMRVRSNQYGTPPYVLIHYTIGPNGEDLVMAQVIGQELGLNYDWSMIVP